MSRISKDLAHSFVNPLQLESLEARLLFSADAGALLVADSLGSSLDSQAPMALLNTVTESANKETQGSALAIEAGSQGLTLVIIDRGVEHAELLARQLSEQSDSPLVVEFIDTDRNGIDQLSELFSRYKNVQSVHLFSHGQGAALQLGDELVDQQVLLERSGQITAWGERLNTEADMLLYGCDLASTSEGVEFLSLLGDLTGSDIAASRDITGSSALGGDWQLEYRQGNIEADTSLAGRALQDYEGVLAIFTVDNGNDSGPGSFRQALLEISASPGGNDILFNYTGEIVIESLLPEIVSEVNIMGNGAKLRYIDGVEGDSVSMPYALKFNGTNSRNSSLSDLSINGFPGDAIVIQYSENITLTGLYIGYDGEGTERSIGGNGIYVNGSSYIYIGKALPNESNVIMASGENGILVTQNCADIFVQNNYIGVHPDDSLLAGNGWKQSVDGNEQSAGIAFSENVTFSQIVNNVIGGNYNSGISLVENSNNNIIEGNSVGYKPGSSGNSGEVVPNSLHGLYIGKDSYSNVVGSATNGNIFSGNGGSGIKITSFSGDNKVANNYIGVVDENGMKAVGNSTGITISDGSVANSIGIDGLGNVISGNDGVGISISGVYTANNLVVGNIIGLDDTGTRVLPNGSHGVLISSGSSYNFIGITGTNERNVISGNKGDGVHITGFGTSRNIIDGNYIGLDSSGAGELLGNLGNGVSITDRASNNDIGSPFSLVRNLISGNNLNGVEVTGFAKDNSVLNNVIGLQQDGVSRSANGQNGILIADGASNTIIGNSDGGGRNTISGNLLNGIRVEGVETGNAYINGNYIGLNVDGTQGVGNDGHGVLVTLGSLDAVIEGNLISGNAGNGIYVDQSRSTVISGNYIGTSLDGSTAIGNSNGIVVENSQYIIIGISTSSGGNLISGNRENGILLLNSSHVAIVNNYIGTNDRGDEAVSNEVGIRIDSSPNNKIGDPLVDGKNIISGNRATGVHIAGVESVENEVFGNYIGSNAAGSVRLGGQAGVLVTNGASKNYIGGASGDEGNVISGNDGHGIAIHRSPDNIIQGNMIGVSEDGLYQVYNLLSGIYLTSQTSGTIIGGATPEARNIITGNVKNGIEIQRRSNENQVLGNYIGVSIDGGKNVANSANGIYIASGSSQNRVGFAIIEDISGGGNNLVSSSNVISNNFSYGIRIHGLGAVGNQISGNYIGTGNNGLTAAGNLAGGVLISGGAQYNIVGSESGMSPNIISANGTQDNNGDGLPDLLRAGVSIRGIDSNFNTVIGNFIGVAVDGNTALGNSGHGIEVLGGSGNIIGGNSELHGNLISGNGLSGIFVSMEANGTEIFGNWIGVSMGGRSALGNAEHGVLVTGGAMATTVGSTQSSGNLISGNSGYGVVIDSAGNDTIISGNTIGLDINGSSAIGNQGGGILLQNMISSGGVVIGGSDIYSPSAPNVISGNSGNGIEVDENSNDNTLSGNVVGLSRDGMTVIGNAGSGIVLASARNFVGAGINGNRNVISGNKQHGIFITADGASNHIGGNYIGTDISGNSGYGNDADGINIQGANNEVGPFAAGASGSVIASNGGAGVRVVGENALGNEVLDSSIYDNLGLAIDLGSVGKNVNDAYDADSGPNGLQNSPELSVLFNANDNTFMMILKLQGVPGQTYIFDFYQSGSPGTSQSGNAETFLLSTTLVADNLGEIDTSIKIPASVGSSQYITAVARSESGGSAGGSSEVSNAIQASPVLRILSGSSYSVSENSQQVYTADATDPGGTGVQWSLTGSGADADRFSITTNGTLNFREAPDYESPDDANGDNVYEVEVSVSYGSAFSIQTVFVSVDNENDNTPSVNPGQKFMVSEGSVGAVSLGVVQGNDNDANSVLGQWVIAGGRDAQRFSIDSSTGTLTLIDASGLDYESEPVLEVLVTLSDGELQSKPGLIQIFVSDRNEAPVIDPVGPILVAENTTPVQQLSANDVDQDILQWSLSGGADKGRFRITADGELSFVADPDYENPTDSNKDNVYEVEVQVSDGVLSDSRLLEVTVTDSNEAPQLAVDTIHSIDGYTGEIGKLQVVDPDTGDRVILTIVGGSARASFTVDEQTHELTQTGELASGTYQLEVQLQDSQGRITNAILQIVIDPSEVSTLPQTGQANTDGTDLSEFPENTGTPDVSQEEEMGNNDQNDKNPPLPGYGASISPGDVNGTGSTESANPGTVQVTVINNEFWNGFSDENYDEYIGESNVEIQVPAKQPDPQLQNSSDFQLSEKQRVLQILIKMEQRMKLMENREFGTLDLMPFSLTPVFSSIGGTGDSSSNSENSVEETQSSKEERARQKILVAGSGATVVLTTGFIAWILNAGLLVSTAASGAPLWRSFDPIPVLRGD